MNGWLDTNGSLHLCTSHTDFLNGRNQSEEGMMKAGWIKLTNDQIGHGKWTGADLEHTTPQQVVTIKRFHSMYGGSPPSILRRKIMEVSRRAA